MDNKKLEGVGFWVKEETGNFLSHSIGLSESQIAYLQSLKKGDRLIIWVNNNAKGSQPTHTLKKFQGRSQPKQEQDDEI